jgi:hypothetical protein
MLIIMAAAAGSRAMIAETRRPAPTKVMLAQEDKDDAILAELLAAEANKRALRQVQP